jgi:hypothetical protein
VNERNSFVYDDWPMLGTEAPRRPGRSFSHAARPFVSLRSPVPLIVAGVGVTLLVIAAVTLPPRPTPEATQTANLSDPEVLTLVAHEMRSGAAAARVINEGQARFDNGTWYVSVGGAHFRFTQRNRIVVAEDPPAVQLEYGG